MKKEQTTSPMGDNQTQAPKGVEPTAQELASILKKCFNTKVIEDCVGCRYNGPETENCLEALAKDTASLIEKQQKQIDVLAKYYYIQKIVIAQIVQELDCPCCSIRKSCFEKQRNEEPQTDGCSSMWLLTGIKLLERTKEINFMTAEENRKNLKQISQICKEKGYLR